MKKAVLFSSLSLLSLPVFSFGKSCEELKSEIDAKLQAKGVQAYTLDIVTADEAGDAKVVGSCKNGTERIIYTRGSGHVAPKREAPADAGLEIKDAPPAKKAAPAIEVNEYSTPVPRHPKAAPAIPAQDTAKEVNEYGTPVPRHSKAAPAIPGQDSAKEVNEYGTPVPRHGNAAPAKKDTAKAIPKVIDSL